MPVIHGCTLGPHSENRAAKEKKEPDVRKLRERQEKRDSLRARQEVKATSQFPQPQCHRRHNPEWPVDKDDFIFEHH
jgi:hypothetical protein